MRWSLDRLILFFVEYFWRGENPWGHERWTREFCELSSSEWSAGDQIGSRGRSLRQQAVEPLKIHQKIEILIRESLFLFSCRILLESVGRWCKLTSSMNIRIVNGLKCHFFKHYHLKSDILRCISLFSFKKCHYQIFSSSKVILLSDKPKKSITFLCFFRPFSYNSSFLHLPFVSFLSLLMCLLSKSDSSGDIFFYTLIPEAKWFFH